jgi:predicted phage terminase large subunit-like protein
LQFPAAAEGTIWRRHWWGWYDKFPEDELIRNIHSWDTAYGKKQATSAGIFAKHYPLGLFLTGYKDEDWDFTEMDKGIRDQYADDPCHACLIENKASGISELQVLYNTTSIPIVAIDPCADKVSRAYAATPYVESGRVFLPKYAPWTKSFVDTMAGFPDIKRKDIPDAFSQLINWVMMQSTEPGKLTSRKVKIDMKRFQKTSTFGLRTRRERHARRH